MDIAHLISCLGHWCHTGLLLYDKPGSTQATCEVFIKHLTIYDTRTLDLWHTETFQVTEARSLLCSRSTFKATYVKGWDDKISWANTGKIPIQSCVPLQGKSDLLASPPPLPGQGRTASIAYYQLWDNEQVPVLRGSFTEYDTLPILIKISSQWHRQGKGN